MRPAGVLRKEKFALRLEHFMLKSQVVSLYRKAIRGTRGIPFDEARYETLKWFRMDFERNRWESDPDRIKYQIQSMQREIKNSLPNYDLSMRPAEGFPRFWKQSSTE